MGKGDKRTKRGKINIGSFGNSRKKAKKLKKVATKKSAPKSAPGKKKK